MRKKIGLIKQAILSRLRKYLLGKHVVALATQSGSNLFLVHVEDYGVGHELLQKGSYGTDELTRALSFVTESCQILIVGAHIGSFAIPLSQKCKHLFAIEANPTSYTLLQHNLVLNKIQNCSTFNVAADNHSGKISFLVNSANSGGSKRIPKVKKFDYYYDKPQTISVLAERLDDILGSIEVDLIIMDIEGSETFALEGMPKLLSRAKVLIVEYAPNHLRFVGGVTVDDFLKNITPHFSTLLVPSLKKKVTGIEIKKLLVDMYNKNQWDSGIIFEK